MAEQTLLTQVTPLHHKKKADFAYEFLREQIASGTFAPGQRVTLAELAAVCGMSNMPVREALVRLEREGLLESEAHKGVRVMPLSMKDARELFSVRTELEGLAAAEASRSGDKTLVKDLNELNLRFASALQDEKFAEMSQANWDFHKRILRSASNTHLSRLLEDVWTASRRYRLGYRLIPGRALRTIEEHSLMIRALNSGDPEAARAATRSHIKQAGDELTHVVLDRGESGEK